MENKDMFRTAMFGGYQKEDVLDYVRSLENENETIRILAKREQSGIKAKLDQEKAAREETRKALDTLQEKIQRLEAEKEEWQNHIQNPEENEPIAVSEEEAEWQKQLQARELRFGTLLEEMKKSNEKLEHRCQELEKYLLLFAEMLDEKGALAARPPEDKQAEPAPETITGLDCERIAVDEPQDEQDSRDGIDTAAFSESEIKEAPECKLEEEETIELADSNRDDWKEPEEMRDNGMMESELSGYERKARQSLQDTHEKIAKLLKSLEDFERLS